MKASLKVKGQIKTSSDTETLKSFSPTDLHYKKCFKKSFRHRKITPDGNLDYIKERRAPEMVTEGR